MYKNGEKIRITRRHRKIVNTLVSVAKGVDPIGRSRHAAAVVRGNRIISLGYNRDITSPFQKLFGKNEDAVFVHAEIDAIKQALRNVTDQSYLTADLKGYDLYVVRLMANDSLGSSKPCLGCQKAIVHFGFSNIYWS